MILNNLSKQPSYTPPKNIAYTKSPNPLTVEDAFVRYANPDPDSPRTVSLIKPPIIFSKNSYSTPLTMPLGPAYLAAVLQKAGYRVTVIDCPGLASDQIRLTSNGRFKVQGLGDDKSIERIEPQCDIIGVTIMFSEEWPHVREYINKIRKAFPAQTIIVGGEHPTAMPEYTLRDCRAIDYLVSGEGELTLLELVYKLRSGQSVHDVNGISFLEGEKFYQTGLSPRLAEIKEMPWPAWDLIDVRAYFHPNFTMGIGYGKNMAMLATRGCPYQCTFCSNPEMWTTRYVMRPVKDVVDEIVHNIETYGANSIDFYDLTAIVKRDWILDFIAELESRDVHIVWQLPSGTRSEILDEPVLKGLARTGCGFLVYAPESGSKKTLDMIKKRVNLVNLKRSVRTAIRYGIVVKINFIIGFPFETRTDVLKTLLFIWELALLKADDCNISTFSPYPGSELFHELDREGRFGKISDRYFENLMTQFDFTVSKTYCRHVGSMEIAFYRIVGMSLFYILSYLRRPGRLISLAKCFFQKRRFQPKSLFEQRVYDMVVRRQKGVGRTQLAKLKERDESSLQPIAAEK